MSQKDHFILFSWFVWLRAAAITEGLMDLIVSNTLTVPCNSSVTLHCNISSPEELTVDYMAWIGVDMSRLCTVKSEGKTREVHPGVHCQYMQQKGLALTMTTVRPADQGKYICKIHSSRGIKNVHSMVKLQECYRKFEYQASSSEITCDFYGVYPRGEVHWNNSIGNMAVNTAENHSEEGEDGLFHVSSTLHTEEPGLTYICSLWIPSSGVYLTSMEVTNIRREFYNGAAVCCVWPVLTLLLIVILTA